MAFPDPTEQRPFVGPIDPFWLADGVARFSADTTAGETNSAPVTVASGKITTWRDAAGGALTFPQTNADNQAALVTDGTDFSYALFDRSSPTDHYTASPSNQSALNTEAAHSFAGVVMSTNTGVSGLIGRYASGTDRSMIGRPGQAPLERFGFMRGASGVYLPISPSKRIAFVGAYDPSVGPLGTLYLMIDGVMADPVPVASGTGAPGQGLSFGSASTGGSVSWAGQVWEMWTMPYNWFAKPSDPTAALQAYRRRQAWRTFVREIYGIDCFPIG